jgi:thermitase
MKALSGGVSCASGRVRAAGVIILRTWDRFTTARTLAILVWVSCTIGGLSQAQSQISASPDAPVPIDVASERSGLDHRVTAHQPDPSPDGTGLPRLAPSDTDLHAVSACWGAVRMNVPEAWVHAGAARHVLVAVLDTGVNIENSGLAGRVEDEISVVSESGALDGYQHGTHVAATIAAIAPNCTILSIRVADDRGCCTARAVTEGILLATRWDASVINLSLQVESSPEMEEAVNEAWRRGAVLVAAAGMPCPSGAAEQVTGTAVCIYPARYAPVIAVAGIDEHDSVAPLSNRASWIDVAAPGTRTVAYNTDGSLSYLTGTSTAAAHASGVAALLYGIASDDNNDGRVNDEVRRAIETTAQPISTEGLGRGVVNALAAVKWLTP